MFRWLGRVFVYLLLLLVGTKRRHQFLTEVKRRCRKRRHQRHVDGITEELDEVIDLPENCTDDVTFVGFTKDGQLASFRIATADKEYAAMSMDLPGIGRFSYSHSRHLKLGAGPLVLKVLEPMRRWKISFHGRVEHHASESDTELIHVSVSLYWQCIADPFDHWSCLSKWQLAGNLSDLAWDHVLRNNVINRERISYEQWGDMWGRITIEGFESQFIRLKGFRTHRIERTGYILDESFISHHLIKDDGCHYITNGVVDRRNEHSTETFGYLTLPVGERWITEQSKLEVSRGKENFTNIKYPLQIYANGVPFVLDVENMKQTPIKLQTDVFESSARFTKYKVNGESAYGVTCQDVALDSKRIEDGPTLEQVDGLKPDCTNLTLRLDDQSCRYTQLVGGKAANISILRALNHTVPNGICITTKALEAQMNSQHDLRYAAERIVHDYSLRDTTEKSRLQGCSDAVQLWIDTALDPTIISSIESEIGVMFGPEFKDISFAVRSSAINEDSKESSNAGQMETFLGVKGLDNILLAVKRCWASSFAYQAVEYRHQNGQPVIEEMAVIIQHMVEADVAGVLFTNDPVTDYTSLMVVNAAPGLGEAVVSGRCNPDTIKVRRNRGLDDLAISETVVGTYDAKLVCATDTGVTEVEYAHRDKRAPCLSEDQVLEVCRIGVQLEESLGYPQDIEWAISNEKLYLLQARPITCQNEETKEELVHEFDTPLATDFECVTTCHVGEWIPRCATTLTQDRYFKAAAASMSGFVEKNCGATFSKYADKSVLNFTNRPFLDMTAMSLSVDCLMQDKSTLDFALTGGEISEHTTAMIQSFKGGPVSRLKSLKAFVHANFFEAPRNVKLFSDLEKRLQGLCLEKDEADAVELFNSIDEHLHLFFHKFLAYAFVTSRSLIPIVMMYKLLRGGDTKVTREVNADVISLLAGCPDVLSVDVPRSIRQLANAIAASELKTTFLQAADEQGHSCLMNAELSIRRKYQDFLRMHGHRCVAETEFFEKSWESDPSKLMRTLKMMIESPLPGSQVGEDSMKANTDVTEAMNTNLSWFKKFFIRTILLSKIHSGIAAREAGKSSVIKTLDVFKRAYWRLAELMRKEGRLPEERLMFFLTHIEIGTLLETRSAALVRKARRRMHILHQQETILYPRLNFGAPIPVSEAEHTADISSLKVNGMPVGKGVAVGRACVVTTLEDADSIQAGDILVCPSTDIGWSPYFSMLAGLVTEMGGLVSHGAVVAREVGIPCIVNAIDATKIIKTGDRVKIDGLAGVLQRLLD